MKENGWLHKRRIPRGVTKATTEVQERENLLKRDFSAQRPLENLLTDITKEKTYQIAAYKLPRERVKTIMFRYIFIYYNRVKIYTRNPLGLPPVKYREWAQAHRSDAA